MEIENNYYNQEYALTGDQIIEAENQNNQNSGRELNAQSRLHKKRRVSKYDDEHYALPDLSDDDDNSTSPQSASTQLGIWKPIAIISIISGILGVSIVLSYFIFLNPRINGNFCGFV